MKIYEPKPEATGQVEEPNECRDCGEVKPAEKFAKVRGRLSGVCRSCAASKRNRTVGKNNAEDRIADETTTDARIQAELWKNYRQSKSTSERIRVLEALVKLRPADQKTVLDDAAVVASLMESLKAKKRQVKEATAHPPTENQ